MSFLNDSARIDNRKDQKNVFFADLMLFYCTLKNM